MKNKPKKINGHTLPDFIAFLNETLIPDLKKSGLDSTAKDFESAVQWIGLQGEQRNELLHALEGMVALYEVMHNRNPFTDDRPNNARTVIAKVKGGVVRERVLISTSTAITSHEDAVCVLTHREDAPGIDWAQLDEHRQRVAVLSVANQATPAERAALDGITSGLDWLTDLAEDAGLFVRKVHKDVGEPVKPKPVPPLLTAAKQMLAYIEMRLAHNGAMSVKQILDELRHVKGISETSTAHHIGCSKTTRKVDLEFCREAIATATP